MIDLDLVRNLFYEPLALSISTAMPFEFQLSRWRWGARATRPRGGRGARPAAKFRRARAKIADNLGSQMVLGALGDAISMERGVHGGIRSIGEAPIAQAKAIAGVGVPDYPRKKSRQKPGLAHAMASRNACTHAYARHRPISMLMIIIMICEIATAPAARA